MLGDSARARKQATAKKPESRISASNACVLTRTSFGVRESLPAADEQQRYGLFAEGYVAVLTGEVEPDNALSLFQSCRNIEDRSEQAIYRQDGTDLT